MKDSAGRLRGVAWGAEDLPMHDSITMSVPVLAILLGILLNQRVLDKLEARVERLETRIDARFNTVDARFLAIEARLDHMQNDFARFFNVLGEHGADIENLKRDRRA